jgi:hypothetical protein
MAIEKNINGLNYHRIAFAYIGQENISRFVVQSWIDKADRLANEAKAEETYELYKDKLAYSLQSEYYMLNYDKTQENADDEAIKAFYSYMKTIEKYQGAKDVI